MRNCTDAYAPYCVAMSCPFLHQRRLPSSVGRYDYTVASFPSPLQASSLFCAFVFQKTSGPDAITLPITPECSYMQPPGGGGGRRQGAGGWGGEEGGGMGHGRGPQHQGPHGGGPGGHFDGPQGYPGGPGPGGYGGGGGGGKRPAEGFPYGPGGGGPGDPNKRPYHGQGAYG